MNRISKNKGWAVLWSASGISFISGILYVWSVISKELIKELHWTSKQASLPYTTVTVAFVIAMFIFGKILDTKGPRICVVTAGLLMGGGLILSGFASEPWMMVMTFGIVTGAGIGITNVAATPSAMKWFSPDKKGLITGIVVGGVGIAPVFFSPAANFLIKSVGISMTFIIFGIIALAVVLPLSRIITNPPAGYLHTDAISPTTAAVVTSPATAAVVTSPATAAEVTSAATTKAATSPASVPAIRDMTRIEMLKTARFYKLWIMLAFSSSAGLMIIGHAANIARVQVEWEGGYLLVILLSIFNALGRLLGGTVSDKIGRVNMMRVIFLFQAVNMLLFFSYQSIVTLAAGIMVAGLCYGATFAVFPPTAADFYGMKNFGSNYGTLFTAWGVGGVIGPMTAASIMDATKNYNSAYIVACVLLIIALLITFTFKNTAKNTAK